MSVDCFEGTYRSVRKGNAVHMTMLNVLSHTYNSSRDESGLKMPFGKLVSQLFDKSLLMVESRHLNLA